MKPIFSMAPLTALLLATVSCGPGWPATPTRMSQESAAELQARALQLEWQIRQLLGRMTCIGLDNNRVNASPTVIGVLPKQVWPWENGPDTPIHGSLPDGAMAEMQTLSDECAVLQAEYDRVCRRLQEAGYEIPHFPACGHCSGLGYLCDHHYELTRQPDLIDESSTRLAPEMVFGLYACPMCNGAGVEAKP